MNKNLKKNKKLLTILQKAMRSTPDKIVYSDNFHDKQVKIINEKIKKAKRIKRIEKF